MGLMIFGFIVSNLLLFLGIRLVVLAKKDVAGLLTLVFGFCFGIYVIIVPSREVIAQETVTRHTITAVNGLYVDSDGHIITEDNIRIKMEGIPCLSVYALKEPPILEKHDITYVKDFSHYGGKDVKYNIVFQGGKK